MDDPQNTNPAISPLRCLSADLVFAFAQALVAAPSWVAGLSVGALAWSAGIMAVLNIITGPRDFAAALLGEHLDPPLRRPIGSVLLILLSDMTFLFLLGGVWPFAPQGWGSILELVAGVFVIMHCVRWVVRHWSGSSIQEPTMIGCAESQSDAANNAT